MAMRRAPDRRFDKARLSLEDVIADAWLLLVEGTRDHVYNEPVGAPSELPVPRILGRRSHGDGPDVAVVKGALLRKLLGRKKGFSQAERHLRDMADLLRAGESLPRVQVWDLEAPLPSELLDKLERRVGFAFERFGPDRRDTVMRELGRRVTPDLDDLGNWFLKSWAWIRRFEGADGRPSQNPEPST